MNNKILDKGPKISLEMIKNEPLKAEKIFNKLSLKEQIELILKAESKLKQELIILSKDAKKLVSLLPEEEIFYTIKDIGIRDAIPLISLTSPSQFQYLLDVDLWKKDTLNIKKINEWLEVLLECGSKKVIEWFDNFDFDNLVLIFKKVISVKKNENLSEPNDTLPDYTLDNIYFIEFIDENLRPTLITILKILYSHNSNLFMTLMERVIWDINAELEEETFYFRNARLKDYGFPDLDEAYSIYQYLPKEKINQLKKSLNFDKFEKIPSYYPLKLITDESFNFWNKAISQLSDKEVEEIIRYNLVLLTNKVIVADSIEIEDIESLKRPLLKVYGYLNIALEFLSEGDISQLPEIIKSTNLQLLFQIGYSQILELQFEVKKKFLDKFETSVDKLDYPLEDIIKGILKKRPLFFSPIDMDYREFQKLDDIRLIRKMLNL